MKKQAITLFVILFSLASVAQTAGDKNSGKSGTVVSTSSKKGWSSAERVDFIRECIGTASKNISEDSARYYCYCMQAKLESKYPDINVVQSKIDENKLDFEKDVQSCIKSGSLWTAIDRNAFVEECIESAKKGMSDTQASSYCECMLYKVEKAYPDPNDANKLTEAVLGSAEWKKKIQACLDF